MKEENLLYTLALRSANAIGNVRARQLIDAFGDAKSAFEYANRPEHRRKNMPTFLANALREVKSFKSFEKELEIIEAHSIRADIYNEDDYPIRLAQCYDAPVVLFSQGDVLMDSRPVLAVVGTRKSTKYGRDFCRKLVEQAQNLGVVLASGLALGIDTEVHRMSLEYSIENWAVVAHGLGHVYPPENRRLSREILNSGLLISEHLYWDKAEKENFPLRNRIIAGLASAVLVVESPEKGGALITAEYANSYNRDVFALPGRRDDRSSKGCNRLIKQHKAHLIEEPQDLFEQMGWKRKDQHRKVRQARLFEVLTEDQKVIAEILKEHEGLLMDQLIQISGINFGKLASLLLEMEMSGVIQALPGKKYALR